MVTHIYHETGVMPLPSCGYTHLEVKFTPKMNCSDRQRFNAVSPSYTVVCEVMSNPPIPPRNVTWSYREGGIVVSTQQK